MTISATPGYLPGIPELRDIFTIKEDTHISRWVRESRRLDHDQAALPRIAMLVEQPGAVIYDVGAFIGDHTAFYAALPGVRRVLAFEAQAEALVCLQKNTCHYRNVIIVPRTVGAGESVQYRGERENNAGARALEAAVVHGCPTVTLDYVVRVAELPPPTLVKLDVEGWEVRALTGASYVLREYHPALVVEVNRGALERAGTSPAELHETIRLAGYSRLIDLFTGLPWEAHDARPQFDVVCR